jgi:hypothetical protein
MLTIAGAIVEHSLRIMFFRHDGRGLPVKKGGPLYLLAAVALLARLARDVVDPAGFSAASSLIGSVIFLLLATTFFKPAAMAALVLTHLFGYVVVAALYSGGISNGYIENGILVWELAALFVVLNQIVRRAREASPNQPPSKDLT